MKITIPGRPIPKARARVINRNQRIWTMDPQERQKTAIRKYLISEMQKRFDSDDKEIAMEASNLALAEEYLVTCDFGLSIPKCLSQVKKKAILDGLVSHTKKPDIDNLEKWVLDIGNGILWKDDSKITQLHSTKHYSETPSTKITVIGIK